MIIEFIRKKYAEHLMNKLTFRIYEKKEPITQEMATAWNNLQGVFLKKGKGKFPWKNVRPAFRR